MAQVYSHSPVLLDEVVRLLEHVPGGIVIDGTLGGAGHARALLERRDDFFVLGLDRDLEACAAASSVLKPFGRRSVVRHARFALMAGRLAAAKASGELAATDEVVGVLLDLGVSSHQLDTTSRGFSYRNEGPLDMRMGTDEGPTAADYLATVDEVTLTSLLVANGERRFARSIARSILDAAPASTAEPPPPSSAPCRPRRGATATSRRGPSRRCASPSTTSWVSWRPVSPPPSISSARAGAWSSSPTTRGRTRS